VEIKSANTMHLGVRCFWLFKASCGYRDTQGREIDNVCFIILHEIQKRHVSSTFARRLSAFDAAACLSITLAAPDARYAGAAYRRALGEFVSKR
jgi:hypothetical protein